MSKLSNNFLMLSLVALFSLTSAGVVKAGAIQLVSSTQLNPGGITVAYPAGVPIVSTSGDVIGSALPNPLTLTAGGNTLTFSKPAGLFVISSIFPGKLSTGNAFGQPGGPININFANGVAELGFDAAPNFAISIFSFTFMAFNGLTPLGTFSVATPTTGDRFIGLRATDGDVITRLVISHSIPDFAIGPVTFGSAAPVAVPEPATMLLLCTGLAGVGTIVRQKRKAKEER